MKIVFFTGAGVSQESGIPTFRDKGGIWEEYPVEKVATSHAWRSDPIRVNEFFNMFREKYRNVKPNLAHKLISDLQYENEVIVITQNVDDLHEQAGSLHVIHLHGELMKLCADHDVENTDYHFELPDRNGSVTIDPNTRVKDLFPKPKHKDMEKRMRPYVVLFGEDVPNMSKAIKALEDADLFVIVGTSLNVYPAAGILNYVDCDVVVIDPGEIEDCEQYGYTHIKEKATVGMEKLILTLNKNQI